MTNIQLEMLIDGTINTIVLTLLSMGLGTVLAFLVALGRLSKSKIISGLSWLYISIFRGTPLFLQLFVVYFAIPMMSADLFGYTIRFNFFTAATIGLTLNTAAYVAEIIRGGIVSIDKGQMEASKALGFTYFQAMTKVIIPQTICRLIPPYANEFVMILKDTSLVGSIGMVELMRVTQKFTSSGNWSFYFVAAGIYLVLTTLSTYIFSIIEKKTSKYL